MIREQFRAMGTSVDVIADSKAGLKATRSLFNEMEARFSRFESSSELSRLNRDSRLTRGVSRPMAEILKSAKELERLSAGSFDVAVGRAVIDWGYDRTIENVRDLHETPGFSPLGTWSIHDRMLTKGRGVTIDLGGIAKGWVADRAVEAGMARLVSAGGDVRSGLDGAVVEIVDPWETVPARINLGRGGLATSSTSKRRWLAAGRDAHHLIDPATGAPTISPVVSATATCSTSTEAEAAAKTMVVKGVDSLAWAESQPWVKAAMVTWHDGSVYGTRGLELVA